MNKQKFLPGALVALLFTISCTKQTVNKAEEPPATTPDTINVTIPVEVKDTITAGDNNNLLLGNPTNALPNSAYPNNYLINQTYYAEAYSRDRGIPVWVSWHLQASDVGTASRQDDFRPYTGLPSGWYQVGASSYNGSASGFDRGHNCPSGDRTSTTAANSTTFYMTNMIPQAAYLNQGPWEGLEDYIRNTLVSTSGEAYIIMGNYGSGGLGRNHTDTVSTLDEGRVAVPKKVWKIAVILPAGNNDLNRITESTTILAVNMPNYDNLYSTNSAGKSAWQNYTTTINDLEADAKLYGVNLDLLSNLNATVKAALKKKKYN
ncbi:DNA/RNA non-specific endonuclease [Filimonas lacunae]|nr:DNA/RNA non-specific endonuclease [Filimonas lacunae]BAV08407.1 sugar-non-specific nuclease NucA homolog [Filimonas lacunae]